MQKKLTDKQVRKFLKDNSERVDEIIKNDKEFNFKLAKHTFDTMDKLKELSNKLFDQIYRLDRTLGDREEYVKINYNFVDMSNKIAKLIPNLMHEAELLECIFDCNVEELMLNLKSQGFLK